jgi:ATP/maltotriose-dependent transcriptional regulator MalT
MPIAILTTKLHTPPVRPNWVPRPRLINRLDEGLNRKLTLVSAPAGYGKTTLITSWLQGLGERLNVVPHLAWLTLEEEENNLARFLTYFVAAWQEMDQAIGQDVLPLLDLPQLPATSSLMTPLINDLARLKRRGVIVVNDYHVIRNPDVHAALIFFLEHLPPQLNLIVVTREEPQWPLARLRVEGQVTEIRLEELRFTGEEALAFLNQTMGLQLSPEDIEILENRTEGWVAGLQMAALSLRGRRVRKPIAFLIDDFGGTHQYVMDYLAAEVLRQQPTEIRAFLRQTAILDRLSAPLCDAVTGQHNSRQFLSQLEQANLFLSQLDDQRQWYRYHSLFAGFLRAELAEWERPALHQRASAWYEANGFVPEAIKHALAAKDWNAVARLIRSSVEEVFSRGGFAVLLSWLNALPEDFVREHSDLSAYKGWILYLRGKIVEAEKYAMAATNTQSVDDSPVQKGMLLGFRAYLAINRDQLPEAMKLAQEALALLGNTQSFFRTTALSHLGQAQRLLGERRAAIQTLRQAVTLGQQLHHDLITMEALGYLALVLYQQGELREALLLCQQAVSQYTDAQGHPAPMLGLVYIPLGVLYFETDDLEHALHCLTTGIELCQQMGTVYFTLAGQRVLARLYYIRGEVEKAWEVLTAARHLAVQSENQRRIRMVNAVTAELQLRQGQLAAAAYTLAELPAAIEARSEQENLTIARLLLAQDQPEVAHELLQQFEQTAREQGRLGSLIAIYVFQALTDQALQRFSSTDPLREALSLAAQLGYYRTLLNDVHPLAAQLVRRRDVAPDLVDRLLATVPELSQDRATTLVEPLSKTQLIILGLVAAGLSNQEIADRVGITVGTTKWYLNQIYQILNVSSRTQAVAKARRLSLL